MVVTISDSPDPVVAGSDISYLMSVGNSGPDPATGATFDDVLPTNTTFVSFTGAPGWTCSTPAVGATGTVSCTNPSVAASVSDAFTLVVNVDPGTAGGSTITNAPTVGTATTDSVPGNDSATATTTVVAPSADLAVSV